MLTKHWYYVLKLKTLNFRMSKEKSKLEFFFLRTPKALLIFVIGYKRDAIAMGMLHITYTSRNEDGDVDNHSHSYVCGLCCNDRFEFVFRKAYNGTSVPHGGTGGGRGGGLGGGAHINNDVEANIGIGTDFGGGADYGGGAGFGDGGIGGGAGFGGGGDFGGGGGGGGDGHVGSAC